MTLDFHTLSINDRVRVQAVSLRAGRRNCNFNFANLVGWQRWFGTEVCVLADAVVLRFSLEGERAYMLCMQGVSCCSPLVKTVPASSNSWGWRMRQRNSYSRMPAAGE